MTSHTENSHKNRIPHNYFTKMIRENFAVILLLDLELELLDEGVDVLVLLDVGVLG